MMRYGVAEVSTLLLAVTLTAQSPQTNGEVRFDVASVKPSTPSRPGDRLWRLTPTGFTGRSVSLRDYLVWAFNTDLLRLITPPSFQNRPFDIVATGANLTPDTLRGALRVVLEERFAVKAHREKRDMDVDALVLANADGKLGPNLRRVSVDCDNPSNKDACGRVSDDFPSLGFKAVDWKNLQIATPLSRYSKSGFIVDRTGLSGQFDVRLTWRSEDINAATNPDNLSRPRLEDALREQLGLKLVPAKESIEVVVIDNIGQPPPD
jgi:uncharacterized protein (TIGR03435 family)